VASILSSAAIKLPPRRGKRITRMMPLIASPQLASHVFVLIENGLV